MRLQSERTPIRTMAFCDRPASSGVKELEAAIRAYIDVHNEDPTPFIWTKAADQILANIAR